MKGFAVGLLVVFFGCIVSCDKKSDRRFYINEEYHILNFEYNRSILTELGIFGSGFEPVALSDREVSKCEVILRDQIETSFNRNSESKLDLSKYGRQYVAAKSPGGEVIVFINCFCQPERFEYRKDKLILASGGGDCFFNLKIILASGKIIDFRTNGIV